VGIFAEADFPPPTRSLWEARQPDWLTVHEPKLDAGR
jgi:hypothetical protein